MQKKKKATHNISPNVKKRKDNSWSEEEEDVFFPCVGTSSSLFLSLAPGGINISRQILNGGRPSIAPAQTRAGNETKVTRRDETETGSQDETSYETVLFYPSRDQKWRDETRFETEYIRTFWQNSYFLSFWGYFWAETKNIFRDCLARQSHEARLDREGLVSWDQTVSLPALAQTLLLLPLPLFFPFPPRAEIQGYIRWKDGRKKLWPPIPKMYVLFALVQWTEKKSLLVSLLYRLSGRACQSSLLTPRFPHFSPFFRHSLFPSLPALGCREGKGGDGWRKRWLYPGLPSPQDEKMP